MGFISQPGEERELRREPKSAELNTADGLRKRKTSRRKSGALSIRRQALTAGLRVGDGARGPDREEQRNSEWEVRKGVTSPAPIQSQILNPNRLQFYTQRQGTCALALVGWVSRSPFAGAFGVTSLSEC